MRSICRTTVSSIRRPASGRSWSSAASPNERASTACCSRWRPLRVASVTGLDVGDQRNRGGRANANASIDSSPVPGSGRASRSSANTAMTNRLAPPLSRPPWRSSRAVPKASAWRCWRRWRRACRYWPAISPRIAPCSDADFADLIVDFDDPAATAGAIERLLRLPAEALTDGCALQVADRAVRHRTALDAARVPVSRGRRSDVTPAAVSLEVGPGSPAGTRLGESRSAPRWCAHAPDHPASALRDVPDHRAIPTGDPGRH